MARTTTDAVEEILGENFDDVLPVAPFVESATVLVDRVQACARRRSKTLTDTELELIERWLAAHYWGQAAGLFDGRATQGVVSGKFQGQTGMHLEGTYYGQRALELDYSGCLTAIVNRQVAGASWLGKRQSEQVEYRQRD